MYSVLVNFLTVVVGGLVGVKLHGGVSEKLKVLINQGLALCVMLIGISGAIATESMILVIISIVAGSVIGHFLRIEDHLDSLGEKAQARFAKNDNSFAQGFVSATLLFSVGSMAIVGSIDAGISGDGSTLLAKSALDGVSALLFASSLGPGVILAAVPMTIYQGAIALISHFAGQLLSADVIREMSTTGSVIVLGLGFNMMGILKDRIRVGNMLPAILLPILFLPVMNWITSLF